MVALCLEYRVEIDAGDSKLLEITELLADSVKVAAEIVVVEHLSLRRRNPVRIRVAVISQNAVGGDVALRLARKGETVGKNLINHSALEPVGSMEISVVHGKLPVVSVALDCGGTVAEMENATRSP